MIEACVADGSHYVNLTGEIPFVRRTIDAFHERAVAAGVKIVQVCGFEALPPDLAVLLAAETARERWGEDLAEADVDMATPQPARPHRPADLISGGTLQSLAEALGGEGAAEIADPAALIADPDLRRGRPPAQPDRARPAGQRPRRGDRPDDPDSPSSILPWSTAPRRCSPPSAVARASRFATARGSRSPASSSVTLPLRYAAAGALTGNAGRLPRADSDARLGQRALGRPDAQAPSRLGLRSHRRQARSVVLAAHGRRPHRRRPLRPRQPRRRRSSRLPDDGEAARRGRPASRRGRRNAQRGRLPDARRPHSAPRASIASSAPAPASRSPPDRSLWRLTPPI